MGNDREQLVLGIADCLGDPVFDLGHLAKFDLPVHVRQAGADDIGRITEAAELLAAPDTGVTECFAQLVAHCRGTRLLRQCVDA